MTVYSNPSELRQIDAFDAAVSRKLEGLYKKALHSVRVSGRLKIAQRFIAGIGREHEAESVKRTAEKGSDLAYVLSRLPRGLRSFSL